MTAKIWHGGDPVQDNSLPQQADLAKLMALFVLKQHYLFSFKQMVTTTIC